MQNVLLITKVLENFYKHFNTDPLFSEKIFAEKSLDYSAKVMIFGIDLIETDKHYENVMSEEARVLTYKICLQTLKQCVALRKEFNELSPSSDDIGNTVAQFRLIVWSQYFAELNLTGSAKKQFMDACFELRQKYMPKDPIALMCYQFPEPKPEAKRSAAKAKAEAKEDKQPSALT